jgi:ABC-2 type transport system permease protein
MPGGNIDMGSTIGSYVIVILISAYSSIGIFTSTLSDNQIVAFILVFLCFFFHFEGSCIITPSFLHLFLLLECKTTLKAWMA